MKKVIFLIVLLSFGCSSITSKRDEFRDKIQEFQEPKVEDQELTDLTGEIQKIANDAKGRVGVDAVVLETGQAVSIEPEGHFPMQSVYKFPIAMAVLKLVD